MIATDTNKTDRQVSLFSPERLTMTVGKFQSRMNDLAQHPGTPTKTANACRAASWLAEVEAFRELENTLLVDGTYEDALPSHRDYLSGLIEDGEKIMRAINESGFEIKIFKFTAGDFAATLDSLRITFRCEHGPKNSQETNQLISQLFDGSKS